MIRFSSSSSLSSLSTFLLFSDVSIALSEDETVETSGALVLLEWPKGFRVPRVLEIVLRKKFLFYFQNQV